MKSPGLSRNGYLVSFIGLNFLADVIFVDKLLTLITFLSETTVGTIVDIVDFLENSNASDRDFLIAKTPTSASQEHHSVSTHQLMSFLIPVFVGCLAVYLAWRLIPRSNVEIKDKYVLITGCDSGFGRKTAIRLDEMGVRVIATCLTKEGEQNLKSVTSDRLKTFQMDVTNSQHIRDVFDEVERRIPDEIGKQTSVLSVVKLSSVCFIWCH